MNIIKRKFLAICAVALIPMVQSCEDFLTEVNPNTVSIDTWFTTIDECQMSLNAVFNALRQTSVFLGASEDNYRADILVPAGSSYRETFTNTTYLQTFQSNDSPPQNKWAALMTGIFRSNQVLEGLEIFEEHVISDVHRAAATLIEAQAYFMRGMFHFWVHRNFNNGYVPYIDKVPSSESEYYAKVMDPDVVLALYRQDLQKAIDLGLPDSWDDDNKGRPTSWAAKAILGKTYLYEEDYETAAEYFLDIIENGGFSLTENIGDNFTDSNEYNEESLLEISYSTSFNTEFGTYSSNTMYNILGMTFAKSGWNSVTPPMWLVEEFQEKELVDQYNDENWIELDYDFYNAGLSDVTYSNTTYTYDKSTVSPSGEAYMPDLIYTQLGEVFETSYTNDSGNNVVRNYVYHQASGTDSYAYTVFRREVEFDGLSGSYLGVTYTDMFSSSVVGGSNAYRNPYTALIFKWENGIPYRLRRYSQRASYSLVMMFDEDLPAYLTMPAQACSFSNHEPAYIRKHTNWDKYDSEKSGGTPAMSSAINYRLIRLADIYLLYAECLIKGGTDESGFDEAMKYVNRVRERGGAVLIGDEAKGEFYGSRQYQNTVNGEAEVTVYDDDDVTADSWTEIVDTYVDYGDQEINPFVANASDLMTHLMYKERPLELCWEGNAIRSTDLMRWGIKAARYKELAKEQFTFREARYLYPHSDTDDPDTEIDETKYLISRAVGGTASRWSNLTRYEDDPDGTVFVDFFNASINYTEDRLYWPIPNNEMTSNPNIVE